MSRLIETIQIKDGILRNMEYHNDRMNRSRKELFGSPTPLDLRQAIRIPAGMHSGLNRCRVLYRQEIEEITIEPHRPVMISSLRLVSNNDIDYTYKFEDRTILEKLYAQRGKYDDILVVKDGYITDTYYCNILLYDGHRWKTPAAPLLMGTMRQKLLDEGLIEAEGIKKSDIRHFKKACLVNALNEFGVLMLDPSNIGE
jgi:4-amino-4-deoxychorismate lyase